MSNIYIKNYDKSYEQLIEDKEITRLKKEKQVFFFSNDKYFFKQTDNYYQELIGAKIASHLNIEHVDYKLAKINFKNSTSFGVMALNYRKNYRVINFHSLFLEYEKANSSLENKDNNMNLEYIWQVLDYHFKNYKNKEQVVASIMDKLVSHFLLDLIIGNHDNGPFNYEILETNDGATLADYHDFGLAFQFQNHTRFTVENNTNDTFYDNILRFIELSYKEYIDRLNKMINTLTLEELEKIFKEVENDISSQIPLNLKNIIFLSYGRHRQNILKILNNKKRSR